MKKFSRKKKWIIFLAVFLCVIVSGVTVFFACSGGGAAQPFDEQPSESMSYRLDPPDDGSLPEDHTQLENLGYIVGRLMARGYYHTDSSSEVSANALGVTVNQYVEGGKNYKDGVLIASTFSRGEGLGAPSPVAMQKFFGADKAVIRSAVSSDPADWAGSETEWNAGEPSEILSREQYSSRYGLWGTEFSDYVMQEDTILSFEEIVREGEEYVLSFSLDPVESTHYYGNQMITMGGLSACPAFEYVNVTLRYTEDWSITEMRISEKYTSSKGIIKAETTGETVISYSYDEADADVSDYEEYFVRYAQADETGPTETERTASDYLAEGFGSVLVSDRTAFAIEAKIGEKTVSGTALLHMSGADAGTMQFAVGALNVLIDINGGEVFLSYKDFNGRLAFADAMALLGVSGGFSLDSLMPALEAAIAGGTVSKGEGSAEVSVVLPLGDMSVPLGFGFSETDAGVSWTYIDAALSLAGTQISLHVTPAPADTELAPVDTEGAVDLFPYIEDILGLVQGKAFSLTVNYAGDGFALAGDVVVDTASGAASGEVLLTAGGVSVPVGFTYAGGEIWLSAGGAKVRAQAGEWLDALLPMLGISLPEAESGLSDLFGGLVGADFGSIFKQFTLADGKLSLVIDGNALLAAFAPDAGVSLGDITAVYDREKGSFSVKVLGAELTLAGTEEEVSLPADADSYVLLRPDDVLPFIEPIAALSSAKDIAFEGYAETEIEGLKLTLGITGEVWFADPEAVRVYLGLVVNGTEEIEIYYADGKVTLAYGAYGMEVAESELKSLAEKFSSLFAAEEGMPVSALLLSSDGLDLAALLDGIKLLGANENGIQFAADLSALLDGMNVTARIGAAENGLTLTEGGLTVAGIALNNVSAQVYAAENAFTPDFSGVEMKEDLVAFLLNVLFGSDRFAVGFSYNGNGFALAGEVVVDVPGAGAAGTVQITASGVSVPVGFVLKNGEIWLSAGGAKVRAQAGEWLDALLPMLGISLPEAESGLSDLFGGLVGADFGSIFKQFTLADGKLSLVIDGNALLAAFAPDAGVSLGDITAVYDREKGSFSVKVLGAELTLAGTEEEVSLPADADSYVLLRPDDVLPFIEPIAALSSAKDIAFEGYAETEIEGLKLTLGITGEVWFADPEAVRVYLGLVVNGTEEIEIYYADGKVTLAYGAYGMEVAESELKSLAEKFSSLFAAEEGMPVSALLLSSDGLDLAALLDGIKLLGANENGIQFAADLSALLDGMNVTARIGAAENGLTLTEGGLTVAGIALNNVSAQVYAADNAFTPDFSDVTMCDDVFELLLNAYIQFADSEFLTLSFDYEDESMKADMTAALRLKRTEENIVFELAAEAVISAGGSNYYMQVSVVDTYAYIYFSLIGFENSVYYPEAVAEGVSPLRAKIAVSSLFDMSSEAMPLIVSLMGLNKNELYYFNFVVELLGGTYETINSDIFGTKTAEEWADLIIGIIKEYTGDAQAQDVSSGNISVSFDAENLALILSGSGMNVVLSAGGEREIKAPADGYTDYSSLAGLVKVLMGSITQSETTEDAEGNPVESAEINSYYYLSGAVTGSLGSIDLTSIGVAASVYVGDDFGVTVNVRLDVSYFVGVFKGDTVLEMTIEDGMVYMVRTQTTAADSVLGLVEVNLDEPIVLYRVTTLDNFFGDILSHLGFLFNFSDSINEQIAGAGSGGSGKSAVTDIGGILTSYEAGQTESGMPQWSFGLDLSSLTDGVLASSTLSLYADAENVLQGMSFTATMPVTSVISLKLTADLAYNNPGESMESGHDADITANVAESVRSLFDKALEETDWSQTSYIEGRTATLTYVAEGQTLMTQTVAYNTSTGALLSYTDLPDLSSFNGEGYTYSWGSIGAISGNTTIDAVKTPNEYTVTIRSEYEIDGLECVRTEGGYFVYELTYTYGTRLDLPVGTEYAKTYELAAFEGEDGSVSSVENITSDVVLTAVWEEIEYTVTYTVLGEVYTTQTYGYGEALDLPEASAEGFAFEGWDTDALTVESDMTVEAILSATVTLGSDFAAEGFAQGEGGWYRSYSLQGTAAEDFAFGLQLSCAGYAQFGWWCEGNGWQYVSSLAGLDGKTVWTAWVSEVKVEVTEAKKSWGLWTINGRYTGGAFSGAVSEQIAASAGISCSAQAWLKLSKDGVNDFDTLNSGNSVGVAADGSFGKGSMTSASDLFGGAKYGGAKVAVTYTYGELSLTLEGVAWKEK